MENKLNLLAFQSVTRKQIIAIKLLVSQSEEHRHRVAELYCNLSTQIQMIFAFRCFPKIFDLNNPKTTASIQKSKVSAFRRIQMYVS